MRTLAVGLLALCLGGMVGTAGAEHAKYAAETPKLTEIVKWPRSEQAIYLRGSLDALLDELSGEVWHCTTPRAVIVADAVDMLPQILPRMKGVVTGHMYMMARAAANGCTWKTVVKP